MRTQFQRRWPVAASLAVAVSLVLLALGGPLTHDVVWQLWVARQLAHGATFYTDIIEVNPPLWFWMAIPIERLSDWLALPATALLIAGIGALAAGALLLTDRLLPPQPPVARALLLSYAAAILLFMPRFDFGQREQIALIAALPYAALIAKRSRRQPVPLFLALAVGSLAAAGFALKHYFAAVPLLLELWLACRLWRRWRPIRAETCALATLAIAYAAAILLRTPQFLTIIVPIVRLTYWGYDQPWWNVVIGTPQKIWLVLLLVTLLLCRPEAKDRHGELATAMGIGAAGFVLAFFAQHKGWQYHAIPATGLLAMTLAMALAGRWRGLGAVKRAIGIAAAALPILFGLETGVYTNQYIAPFRQLTQDLPAGSSIGVLGTMPRTAWPMVEDQHLLWPLRNMSFWMMPAIGYSEWSGHGGPAITALGRLRTRQVVEDFTCHPPARILIERHPSNMTLAGIHFDYGAHFSRDPAFARLMRAYRPAPGNDAYVRYDRVAPLPPLAGLRCRTIR
jgi:hypothetical protein